MKKSYFRRIVKNSKLQKILNMWGDEFYHKRKDRKLNRTARARIKENTMREIKGAGDKYA